MSTNMPFFEMQTCKKKENNYCFFISKILFLSSCLKTVVIKGLK